YLMATANVSQVAFNEGRDWDEALEIIEDALPMANGEHVLKLKGAAAMIRSARGEPVDDLLTALDGLRGATDDPNNDIYIHVAHAASALARGDFEASERYARSVLESSTVDKDPVDIQQIGLAVIPQGDAVKARALAGLAASSPFQGTSAQAFQAALDAGALALEGRRAEAVARFTEGVDAGRSTGMDFDLALWELTAVRCLPDVPEAVAWAAEARAVFERVGARAFLAQLDEVAASTPPRLEDAGRVTESDTAAVQPS
ncbi:MAG: hypothetical protein ACRDZV_12820, partial [Acidimicrobiia bacterium]